MSEQNPCSRTAIGWKRAARIFGNPKPPEIIREMQFDGNNDTLQRLASTPYEEIDFSDLWDYHHDLAYVRLQPELFKYLFPVCLMDWHDSLMRNEACSHGDSEFHYGIRRGAVFEKMLTPAQRQEVFEFFRDSFLARLDAERLLELRWQITDYGWLDRFNSLGLVVPRIELVWNAWWEADTAPRALCLLKYCSAFIYFASDNPLLDVQSARPSERALVLWGNDSQIQDAGWLEPNVEFLRQTLTADYVQASIGRAAARLEDTAAGPLARRIVANAAANHELLESRVGELPARLADPYSDPFGEWSV